jgi:hypothetical protein
MTKASRTTRRLMVCAVLAWSLPAVAVPAQEVAFTAGKEDWDTSTRGNHRAVLRVDRPAEVAHAVIPWRRRDPRPEQVRVLVFAEATGVRLANVTRGAISRERGEIWFEPSAGAGRYFVYYLPFQATGTNYPRVTYLAPDAAPAASWIARLADRRGVVEASVEEIQAIDEFNSFFPMEVIATAAEAARLVASRPGAEYLVFPEDRAHPIRMRRDLPLRWVEQGPGRPVVGQARLGEYFAFQLGVHAIAPLRDLQVRFSDLVAADGARIDAARLDCLNGHGTGWDGRPFTAPVGVEPGTVQALWCAADVPGDARPGVYRGSVTVAPAQRAPVSVDVVLTVLDTPVADGGADEPWLQTRLKWLNSTRAQRNDVIPPYTPLTVTGNSIGLLGRRVVVGALGLPGRIETFFAPEMTRTTASPTQVLAAPVDFTIVGAGGETVPIVGEGVRVTEATPGTVRWEATGVAGPLALSVGGRLEFDGFLACSIAVTAGADADLADIGLDIPYAPAAATHMMGLGQKGGRRPRSLDWAWDVATRNQDGAWIGGVNAGLYFSLRAENYSRPLNTNFYLQKPLALPPSWGNAGRGGITVREDEAGVRVRAFSGPRRMQAGETLYYDVVFIVTPFHAIDTDFQWRTRFYHRYGDPQTVAETGATVVNIHHATPINPWINYPFIAHREMKAYVDEAHERGLLVKIYNTVRELSNRAHELFPLRSLGHEVFTTGPGGGFAWLQEHLGDDYLPAWFVPELQDAAIINSGMSRWHNYYVEGMRWLVEHVGIDGIYLDDVAFDRTTMKRIKRVLTEGGHPGIVDLHSANQFNERDGFVNSAVLYLEHFPYLNRLWFGEYFDYESSSPDFYLTEISGIPFGLMGEMLQDGGNPWRGLVFGMTNRMPWNAQSDPRPIWRAWDAFGMQGTEMIGHWAPNVPVKTGRADVLATVYRKPGAAMVALASWADAETEVALQIDWAALGIDPARARIEAPEIAGFQPARTFVGAEPIPVPKGKGWLLVIR